METCAKQDCMFSREMPARANRVAYLSSLKVPASCRDRWIKKVLIMDTRKTTQFQSIRCKGIVTIQRKCPLCKSSLKRKWLRVFGCLNPSCKNYCNGSPNNAIVFACRLKHFHLLSKREWRCDICKHFGVLSWLRFSHFEKRL